MKQLILGFVAAVVMLGGDGTAKADLVGLSVNSTYYFPDLSSLYENDGTQTVPASFTAFGQVGEQVTGSQIIITNVAGGSLIFSPGAFNGPVFDFLLSRSLIQSVTIDGVSTDSPIVSLLSDGAGGQLVEVNMQNLSFDATDNVTLDINTGASSVPEPSTIALSSILFGVFGTAWVRKRLKRTTRSA